MRRFSVAAALLAATMLGWAFPTLYGDSGLVQVPTADVLPDTFVELSMNYAAVNIDGQKPILYPLRLTYGASENTELFVNVSETSAKNAEGGFDGLGAGFKVQIIPERLQSKSPGLAFGARLIELNGAVDRTQIEGYGVVTKTLYKQADLVDEVGFTIRGHLAGIFTRFSGEIPSKDFITAGVGLSYNNFNGTSIALDYLPKLESGGVEYRKACFSAAVRRPLSKEFLIELGTTQPYGIGSSGQLYAGLMYQWGIRDAPTKREPRVDAGY